MHILTLTLNPAIDHILTIDKIALRKKNTLSGSKTFCGGKGVNVAFVLGKLGVRVTALGLIGKTEINSFSSKLSRVGIQPAFTPVQGTTRQAYKVMETSTGKDTEFNQSGEPISPSSLDAFMVTLNSQIESADWVVLCGSIPSGVSPEIYAQIIRVCHDKGVKTLLDASGVPLLRGVKAVPTFLKINNVELDALKTGAGKNIQSILHSMNNLHQSGIAYIVVSLGSEGALGYDGSAFWKVNIPAKKIKGLTGAGDAMTGGLLATFSEGRSFEDALHFAGALATASTQKFEPGDFDHSDLEQILGQTDLKQITLSNS